MPVPGEVHDPAQLDTSEVALHSAAGPLQAYLARPRDAVGTRPGVIVIHEAMGLNAHIRDVACRFAAAGFDALAPELYTRIGPPRDGDWDSIRAKMSQLADSEVIADLDACATHLRGLDTASGRIGCVGFCAGGRSTLLFACNSRIDAAVDCWGGSIHRASPDAETTPQRPVAVVAMLDSLSCPLLLVGGAEDANPSPELLRDVTARLQAAGKDVTLHIYDGAGHAFFADYRPSYREAAAFELWPEMLAFFRRHLG
jgi:carboxymethylenebutenolidase